MKRTPDPVVPSPLSEFIEDFRAGDRTYADYHEVVALLATLDSLTASLAEKDEELSVLRPMCGYPTDGTVPETWPPAEDEVIECRWVYCGECNGIGQDENVPFFCATCNGEGGWWQSLETVLIQVNELESEINSLRLRAERAERALGEIGKVNMDHVGGKGLSELADHMCDIARDALTSSEGEQ